MDIIGTNSAWEQEDGDGPSESTISDTLASVSPDCPLLQAGPSLQQHDLFLFSSEAVIYLLLILIIG